MARLSPRLAVAATGLAAGLGIMALAAWAVTTGSEANLSAPGARGSTISPTDTPSPMAPVPPAASPTPGVTPTTNPGGITFTFDGDPAGPESLFHRADFDVQVHRRGLNSNPDVMQEMHADHGVDCSAPPASHPTTDFEGRVFQCRNHAMTAARDGGYELVYLTPNQMADWSDGEAIIRLDVSSLAQSSRDWWDVVIQPFDDNWALPVNHFAAPDLQGPAPNSIVFTLHDGDGAMAAQVHRDGRETLNRFETSHWWTGVEAFLQPSASVRSTWEFRVSRTHISACLVSANGPTDPGDEPLPFCFVDLEIDPLTWTRGTISLGHHSYTPDKACKPWATEPGCATTWHWDNLSISPSIPFTMIRAEQRYVWEGWWYDRTDDSERTLTFPEPAPPNSYLRFSAIGTVTLDGVPVAPLAGPNYDKGHFSSYFLPIPEGTRSVVYKGGPDGWWNDNPTLKDAAIWSQTP